MVKRSYCCCCCDLKFDIPAGLTTLEESCGKSTGVMQPGAQWCYCCTSRVACMVTQAIVNYNAPVHNCPTKDNAYISVDLYFSFRMPRQQQEVKNFVYRLGAGRFDELLYAEIDEGIRNFINGIWLSQVFDLKGDMARQMIQDLNSKFSMFGVIFENCNVTNVHVNQTLTQALEEKTKCKYMLANHIKEYGNQKLTLENQQNQELTDMKRDNDRKMQDLKSQIDRAKVEQDQFRMTANTNYEVAIVKAEETGTVLITQVEGEKNTTASKAQGVVVEIVNRARAEANQKVTAAKQMADVKTIEADSKLQATKALYAALAEEGKAEAANLDAFDAQRRHNYEIRRAMVFEELARSGKNIVVSGETGSNLLSQLISADGVVAKKK